MRKFLNRIIAEIRMRYHLHDNTWLGHKLRHLQLRLMRHYYCMVCQKSLVHLVIRLERGGT